MCYLYFFLKHYKLGKMGPFVDFPIFVPIHRKRAIISCGLYFFPPIFTLAVAYIADNLCTEIMKTCREWSYTFSQFSVTLFVFCGVSKNKSNAWKNNLVFNIFVIASTSLLIKYVKSCHAKSCPETLFPHK